MTQPSDYAQARAEAAALLDLDLEQLSPADAMRLDLAVVLRRAIDAETESGFDGGPIDLPRLLTAIERLTALLPARELSASKRVDPREQMWAVYCAMRERGEIGERRAADPTVITPTEADVVPPSEIGEFFRGPPKPGPDDWRAPPRTPRVIEGKATAAPGDDMIDIRNGFDDTPEPWRAFSHLYEK
jgi:hypothetical protein